ncbi:cobalamin synthesis protein cobW-like protein [Microbacterium sp. SLBN-154]|uniref:GTP-binding protein n=1 Tax=Microbacterium sp. SLBN-154 TaxID=2768458 RepID=UPI001153794A|nr:GTP-binding protein [Microbacterium sp. SLBN-154]TQK18148.1 cobalamin synthesis protein cobW-like protein [Microbacterium sp. SLBN-154]
MDSGSILVVGVCAPERRRYAQRLAELTERRIVGATGGRRHGQGLVLDHASADAPRGRAVVIDAATDVDAAHLAGAEIDGVPLFGVICVVDAAHLLDDLKSEAALVTGAPPGDDRGDIGAWARQAAALIELADVVAFVGWEACDTPTLSLLMSLASHLSPTARIRLSRRLSDDLRALREAVADGAGRYERAGWVRALDQEHDPYMTDRRVTTFRYEQLRPFHPQRLMPSLDEIASGRWGTVVRSMGFCRLATRPTLLARWEQAGSAMWIDPIPPDDSLSAIGQEIAVTGWDLDVRSLVAMLDDAALTDEEFAAGSGVWRDYEDPLPQWVAWESTERD